MYSLVVVEVNVAREALSLAGERYARSPVIANTLCLERAVKAFDVGIVVWPVQAAMAHLDAASCESILVESAVFWPIVALHYGEAKAECSLCLQHCTSGQPSAEPRKERYMGHARVEINDRVVIHSSSRGGIDMVNSICLYKLTRRSGKWTLGVISAHTVLSASGNPRPPQNTSDTTQ